MSTDIVVVLPTAKELTLDAVELNQAKQLTITSIETHGIGEKLLVAIAAKKKFLTEKWATAKKKAHEAHREVCKLEAESLAPYLAAEKVVIQKLDVYETAEKKRAEEEARVKAEQQRKEEEERKLREAEIAKSQGASEKEALAILDEPSTAPPPAPDYQFAGTKGVGKAKPWKGRVKSMQAFIRWLAKQPDNEPWFSKIELGQSDLDNAARMYEGALAERIPGLASEQVEQRRTRA